MPQILDRPIDRVLVVDDQPDAREGHTWLLEDAHFEPVLEPGPLDSDPRAYTRRVVEQMQVEAALCDERLGVRGGYASYFGSALIKAFYQHRFPAVLCTRYEDAAINDIRPFRRWIPVLLTPDELNEDAEVFGRACAECVYELDVGFRENRKPWRAQLLVADEDEKREHFWFQVPAWEHNALIRMRANDLPREIVAELHTESRLFAQINLGAERTEDLYFYEWELPR